jgi:hypothetical protein
MYTGKLSDALVCSLAICDSRFGRRDFIERGRSVVTPGQGHER